MKPNRLPANFGKWFGLFALGAAAGSLCGVLFAPASGSATRKRIGLKFKSLEQQSARQIKQANSEELGRLLDAAIASLPGSLPTESSSAVGSTAALSESTPAISPSAS